ncbi:MAG: sulfatase [Gemmataceae bacterium]|nr:sulfatase [Gemmataceae bacterium]
MNIPPGKTRRRIRIVVWFAASIDPRLGFVLAAVLFLANGLASRADEPRQRPNVLFIAIDDLNDWVGFLGGHPQVKTPHMDRLAKRGVVFANAHCAAPLCSPSRAAVFSGKQPFHTGVYGNDDNILTVRPPPILLSEYFKAQGYRTYGTGKLLHQNDHARYDESFAAEQRWSPFTRKQVEYSPEELPTKATDRPRHVIEQGPGGQRVVLPLNGLPSDRAPRSPAGESFDWGPVDVADGAMGDAKIVDWAAERLRRRHEQPFLLAVGFYRPHIPLFAPKKYFDLYPADAVTLPDTRKDDLNDLGPTARRLALVPDTAGAHATVIRGNQWKPAVAAYLACVSFVDTQVGRLLDALDRSQYADNTVVVLWSDHGWHLGEKQHWGKWTGWERATRVPLAIVPAKGSRERFRPGAVCRQPVGLIDLYPTLLDLCGLPAKADLDGVSLVPQLRDPTAPTRPALTTFGEGNYAVRDGRWRLIRYADGSEELYDHRQDPHEWNNLVGDPKLAAPVKALRQVLSSRTKPVVEKK